MISFSVVIPCYNSEKTIETCVRSVFSQHYLPKEIIVIDDGSHDKSLSILKNLQQECPKSVLFLVITQENSGPSTARNNGVKKASSEWIAFLDSDDFWTDNNLNIAKNFIENDQKGYSLIGKKSNQKSFSEVTFNQLLFKNAFQTSSTIVKKECLLKYPFNEKQKYSEDYRTWLLICYEYPTCTINGINAHPVINRKYSFSGGGLSSKLWEMEKGELNNYCFLKKTNRISVCKLIIISSYSMFKYGIRLLSKLFR
ncbi:glycosyltransferase family 2 protein [Capnocytophaga sp.]|uniref:glycosyltransferase family 2 protein n=1 Tax=Capnocytophaga sp. TaxID=44737 RepID=UPI0026DD7B34|nr:glycosyltransferase family 2 protein [Capnocytophaga sp.]MDO5104874.1 glycosyltransferase family 2 protein [Capnocytophaga sp.]